jgi:hypothetical protein
MENPLKKFLFNYALNIKPFSKPHFSGFPLKYDIKLYVVFKAFHISYKLAYRSTSTIQQKLGGEKQHIASYS